MADKPEPIDVQPVAGTPPQGAPETSAEPPTKTPEVGTEPRENGPHSPSTDLKGRGVGQRGVGQSVTEIGVGIIEALQGTGAKGRALTEGMIAAGLARDPTQLRRAYQQNQEEIDTYLAQIDTSAIVRQSGASDTITSATSGAALGFAGGAILTYLYRQLTK